MKKQLLLFFLLLVGASSYAQIGAGTVLAGGDLAYSRQSNKTNISSGYNATNTYSVFAANPKAGFFISENLVVGTGLSYQKYTDRSKVSDPANPEYKNSTQTVGFSPFGRYYKMLGERAGFFGQLTTSFLQSTTKPQDGTENKFNAASLGVAPGFVFFATPNIGIETTVGNLGYYYSKNKPVTNSQGSGTEGTTNGFTAGVNASNVFLGINYYFGR